MILLLLLQLVFLFLLLMGLVILVLILLLLLPPRISSFGLLLEVLRLFMVLDLLLLQFLNLNELLVAAGDTKVRPVPGRTILLGLLAFISLAPGVVQDATPELAAIGCSTGLLTFSIAGMDLGRTACSSIRSSYCAGAAAAAFN